MIKIGWTLLDRLGARQVRAAHRTALRQLAQLPPHLIADVNALDLPAPEPVEASTSPKVPPDRPWQRPSSRQRVNAVRPSPAAL